MYFQFTLSLQSAVLFACLLYGIAGVEGCETAIKLSRKWGYRVKRVPTNEARHVYVHGNFWGRTMGAISASDDPSSTTDFGPYMPGYKIIPYDDLNAVDVSFFLVFLVYG